MYIKFKEYYSNVSSVLNTNIPGHNERELEVNENWEKGLAKIKYYKRIISIISSIYFKEILQKMCNY